jgi:hypothetical protein
MESGEGEERAYYFTKKIEAPGMVNVLVDPSGRSTRRMASLHDFVRPLKGHCVKRGQIVPIETDTARAVLSGHKVISDTHAFTEFEWSSKEV